MYKVLIIDDEMIIRIGLKSSVDWESLGYVYAGEAVNGEDALELCRNVKPDIVLTDIKMPKMDGIEFITALLKEQPDVKIVVLSCVDDFDKLQQALRLGVKDYFLKLSFSPEQLVAILKKIKGELDLNSKNKTGDFKKLSSIRDDAIVKENFYKNLIATQFNKIPLSDNSKISINPQNCENAFILLIAKDQSYEEQKVKVAESSTQKFSIISLITEILSKEFECDVVEIETDLFMAVCENSKDYKFDKIYVNAIELQNNLMRIMYYSVSVAVNLYSNCIDNFYSAYQQCLVALQQKFYEGHQSIIFYDELMELSKDNTNYISSNIIEGRIQNKLEYFEFQDAKQIVLQIIDSAIENKNWNPSEFKRYFPEIVAPWYRAYKHFNNNLTSDKNVINPYKQIDFLETIVDIRQWFDDYSQSIETLVKEYLKSSKVRTELELAKKYINDNYNSDININDVAKLVGFNSSYFSHLFKKEMGEGISDYLTNVRLSRAFKLLRETLYSVNQISEMVGFNDVAYFRKQFRKHYSKSPSECRNDIS